MLSIGHERRSDDALHADTSGLLVCLVRIDVSFLLHSLTYYSFFTMVSLYKIPTRKDRIDKQAKSRLFL